MNGLKTFIAKLIARNPVSFIMLRVFKKRVSFNHLTIRTIAFLLRQRISFRGCIIDVSDKTISPSIKSYLYYGIYEKNEIDLVTKYLSPTDTVIELGSSIGVMGCIISQIQSNGKYIAVEADPSLIEANKTNLALNRDTDYLLLNKAIGYTGETIAFAKSDNSLAGRVGEAGNATVTVEAITLGSLCQKYDLKEFVLVCDIEGAEITILINDQRALENCSKMIIELHDTEYMETAYTRELMSEMIQRQNFKLLEQQGTTYAFQRG